VSEKIYKGYKATDKDIKCRDYQFVVGEWHEHQGEVELCKSGFHFCTEPSGPWCYYSDKGTRVWQIEATGVIESNEPGADRKFVAHRIRLVREIISDGHRNTGHRNTGHRNTGDCNTGDYNTGHRNTGDYNTGHRNTGDYNLSSFGSGFFATEEPNATMFGFDTGMNRQVFLGKFGSRIRGMFDAMKSNRVAKEIAIKFGDIPCVTEENVQRWKDKYNQLYGEAKQ
jgi:hypothetical protein